MRVLIPNSNPPVVEPLALDSRPEPALGSRAARLRREGSVAFSLLEVMIACGIFFMATFAILALVSNSLRNARALQRSDVDAGMAAAQIYQTLHTNREDYGSLSGDFGDSYPDYSWDANWDEDPEATNGLLKVNIVVNRRGSQRPADKLTIWVFDPNATFGH